MPPYEYLKWSIAGPIAEVRMDRPPVNAVNDRMYRELNDLFASVDDLFPGVRCLILSGNGKHFCAGHELEEFATMSEANSVPRMRSVREAFWAIRDCPVPVIAAVHGAALGTGVAIAASCDLVVAARSARFGTPEIGLGVMGGAKHLSRLVPEGLLRRMYLTGVALEAKDLAAYGGIAELVPDDEVIPRASALAEAIVCHSKVAVQTAKSALNSIEYLDLKSGYEYEQSLTTRIADHPDAREACRSAIERRKANYCNT